MARSSPSAFVPAKVAAPAPPGPDAAPPVVDPVHSLLASMLQTLDVFAGLVPGAHNIQVQYLDPMRKALSAITAQPK